MSLTDSDHNLPVAPNRLLAQAQPTHPDAVWVADITYVETREGFLYGAGILDRCRRRCVGWAMGDTLATTLPLAALDMALTHRRPNGGLLHHSDQGRPIRQPQLPAAAGRGGRRAQHEPPGQLL